MKTGPMKIIAAALITLASLVTGVSAPAATASPAAPAAPAPSTASLPAPVHHGPLRVSGTPRDGATVTATGLSWHSPLLSWWGRQYADGAVVEECYSSQQCFARQFQGSQPYEITCTALSGPTPCGWDDFTAAGQWVGEAEYAEDGYVCNPGKVCQGPHSFGAFCRAVYAGPHGFAAVKFGAALDGALFHPCPRG